MPDEDESLDRIEAALERIGRRVEQPDPVAGEVAARLDAVIARLRAELPGPAGALADRVPDRAPDGTAEEE